MYIYIYIYIYIIHLGVYYNMYFIYMIYIYDIHIRTKNINCIFTYYEWE